MLTILVSIVSANRSFSKLKIIKTYLRSILSQEKDKRISPIIYWERNVNKINYDNLINNFVQKIQKINFK